jgi:predicted amidophosphoribosyltransferase
LVTSIPATPSKMNSLSWNMAKFVCEEIGVKLLISTLKAEKNQTKGLSIEDKIKMWKNIYENNGVRLSEKVSGKKILIIDDLYQSGTSIWSFAKYLKSLGATKVFALVAVKSQRDSDNK